jgi:hypothetical protein
MKVGIILSALYITGLLQINGEPDILILHRDNKNVKLIEFKEIDKDIEYEIIGIRDRTIRDCKIEDKNVYISKEILSDLQHFREYYSYMNTNTYPFDNDLLFLIGNNFISFKFTKYNVEHKLAESSLIWLMEILKNGNCREYKASEIEILDTISNSLGYYLTLPEISAYITEVADIILGAFFNVSDIYSDVFLPEFEYSIVSKTGGAFDYKNFPVSIINECFLFDENENLFILFSEYQSIYKKFMNISLCVLMEDSFNYFREEFDKIIKEREISAIREVKGCPKWSISVYDLTRNTMISNHIGSLSQKFGSENLNSLSLVLSKQCIQLINLEISESNIKSSRYLNSVKSICNKVE